MNPLGVDTLSPFQARKVAPVETFEMSSGEGSTAYVLYKTVEQAVQASKKLDGAKLVDGTAPISAKIFSTAKLRQFRIIIRNLPWNVRLDLNITARSI